MYFDTSLPYPQAFQDAVERETDRVTSDPATARVADAVNARGIANELDRVQRGRANVADAWLRHGRDSDNVPAVVDQSIDRATRCHLATSRVPFTHQRG
jgi:hypothetical protein